MGSVQYHDALRALRQNGTQTMAYSCMSSAQLHKPSAACAGETTGDNAVGPVLTFELLPGVATAVGLLLPSPGGACALAVGGAGGPGA